MRQRPRGRNKSVVLEERKASGNGGTGEKVA